MRQRLCRMRHRFAHQQAESVIEIRVVVPLSARMMRVEADGFRRMRHRFARSKNKKEEEEEE